MGYIIVLKNQTSEHSKLAFVILFFRRKNRLFVFICLTIVVNNSS